MDGRFSQFFVGTEHTLPKLSSGEMRKETCLRWRAEFRAGSALGGSGVRGNGWEADRSSNLL
jgi:hypothetical protein